MQITKEIVGVGEMARLLGLSRARFYQLMKEGVFPEPMRNDTTKRPFYDRVQQERCIEVRRTNRGVNGRAILFYAMRAVPEAPPARLRPPGRTRSPAQSRAGSTADATIRELRQGLSQLGLVDVREPEIRSALAEAFPDGWTEVPPEEVLRSVFGRLNRRDTPDNVAG